MYELWGVPYSSFLQSEESLLSALMAFRTFHNVFAQDYLNVYADSIRDSRRALKRVKSHVLKYRKLMPPLSDFDEVQTYIDYLQRNEHVDGEVLLDKLIYLGHVMSQLKASNEMADWMFSRSDHILKTTANLPVALRDLIRDDSDKIRDSRKVQARYEDLGKSGYSLLVKDISELSLLSGRLVVEAEKTLDAVNSKNQERRLDVALEEAELNVEMRDRIQSSPAHINSVSNDLFSELVHNGLAQWQQNFDGDETTHPDIAHKAVIDQFSERLDRSFKVLSDVFSDHMDGGNPADLIEFQLDLLSRRLVQAREGVDQFYEKFNEYHDRYLNAPTEDIQILNRDISQLNAELDYFLEFILNMIESRLEQTRMYIKGMRSQDPSKQYSDRFYEIESDLSDPVRADAKDPEPDLAQQLYADREDEYGKLIGNWIDVADRWVKSKKNLGAAAKDINDLNAKLDLTGMTTQLERDMTSIEKAGASEVVDEQDFQNLRLDEAIRMDARKPPWFKMPFAEAQKYFAQKDILGTYTTQGIPEGTHEWAFMVSGVTRADILSSIRWLLDRAIADGTTEQQFHRSFKRLVGRKGWRPGSSRIQLIFTTNMRSSYGAGRYKQIFGDDDLPETGYLLWRWGDSRQPRPHHKALNNKAIPKNHRFFDTAYPPCGYGCKCKAFYVTPSFVKKRGYQILSNPPNPKTIADPGWRSNPSQVFESANRSKFIKKGKARQHPAVVMPT